MKSIFDLSDFKPYKDVWDARRAEYARRRGYADGSIYRAGGLQPLASMIRPIYLPLDRAVVVDTGLIPQGWRLAPDSASLARGVSAVLAESDWKLQGQRYVRLGALLGASVLKVVDDWTSKRVRIQVLPSDTVMIVPASEYDDTPKLAIIAMTRRSAGNEYEYAEVITPDEIVTFRDGEMFGFGGRPPRVDNVLGFVPLVEVQHIVSDDGLGVCTFQSVIPILDELNRLATTLVRMIEKHGDPQWVMIGVEGARDDEIKRGSENIWFVPDPKGDVKALVAPVDFNSVLSVVKEIAKQVNGGLPELAFDELRGKYNIATATVEMQLLELTIKIAAARASYDNGLARALRLAGRAAGVMGLGDLARLDTLELAFDSEREILPLNIRPRSTMFDSSLDVKQVGG